MLVGGYFFCQAGDSDGKITKWGIIKERIKRGEKRWKKSKEKEVKNKRQRKPGQRKKVKKGRNKKQK